METSKQTTGAPKGASTIPDSALLIGLPRAQYKAGMGLLQSIKKLDAVVEEYEKALAAGVVPPGGAL